MRTLDIVVNLWTPDLTQHYTPKLNAFWQKVKILGETSTGIPLEEELRRMDAAGIEKGLLVATTGGREGSDIHFEKPVERIAEVVAAHPQRFKGVVGINVTRIVHWLARLEYAVRELGFVARTSTRTGSARRRITASTIPSTPSARNWGSRSRFRWATRRSSSCPPWRTR